MTKMIGCLPGHFQKKLGRIVIVRHFRHRSILLDLFDRYNFGLAALKPIGFYDTECYPNYWLFKVKVRDGIIFTVRLLPGQSMSQQDIDLIVWFFENLCMVSFNGNYYDVPMITGALCGYTCEQLKWLNDQMIPQQIKGQPKVFGKKPWELDLPRWEPADHIDIMEVCPGAGSLKQFAARIHSKRIQDLPYDPFHYLTATEIPIVDSYCDNDLSMLEDLFNALAPQLKQRNKFSVKYEIDLRSKSDAQMAEAVLKKRCEIALGVKLRKPEINYNHKFRYNAPDFISFSTPQLQRALALAKQAVFGIRPPAALRGDDEKGKCIIMPPELEDLKVSVGNSIYKMGMGGLHSQEKQLIARSTATHVILMPDVASYYPESMLKAGAWPSALGESFVVEFRGIINARLQAKALAKKLKAAGFEGTVEYEDATTDDGGGKIMINGTFGKTGSPYSILWAPEMLIQTTLTGQLSLLMLIEWLEYYGIQVISANTDGLVVNCPRHLRAIYDYLIKEWETRTGLTMETKEYIAIYARDVNSYFAIETADDVKRKGEYAKSGLVEKKNPDVEICSEAVTDFLAKGIPIEQTIKQCRDIRKFISVIKVAGGGVKMWGEGPRKGALVRDILPVLEAHGWTKTGPRWERAGCTPVLAREAYEMCFTPQVREYLGKVVRWYYSTQAPGPIISASNGNTVSLSYGARPCMILPDEFPADVDYQWYLDKCENILKDIGYYVLTR